MDEFKCPTCGHEMKRDIKPFTVVYGDLSASVGTPGWYCTNCDEAVFIGRDMDTPEKARLRLKAKAEELLLPEDIKRIRKKLKLSQEAAGQTIGGGPNAFHKYESGTVLPSLAVSNLLRWLEVDSSGLKVFAAHRFATLREQHGKTRPRP